MQELFIPYELAVKLKDFGLGTASGDRVSRTCTKCGYHKSYWKW